MLKLLPKPISRLLFSLPSPQEFFEVDDSDTDQRIVKLFEKLKELNERLDWEYICDLFEYADKQASGGLESSELIKLFQHFPAIFTLSGLSKLPKKGESKFKALEFIKKLFNASSEKKVKRMLARQIKDHLEIASNLVDELDLSQEPDLILASKILEALNEEDIVQQDGKVEKSPGVIFKKKLLNKIDVFLPQQKRKYSKNKKDYLVSLFRVLIFIADHITLKETVKILRVVFPSIEWFEDYNSTKEFIKKIISKLEAGSLLPGKGVLTCYFFEVFCEEVYSYIFDHGVIAFNEVLIFNDNTDDEYLLKIFKAYFLSEFKKYIKNPVAYFDEKFLELYAKFFKENKKNKEVLMKAISDFMEVNLISSGEQYRWEYLCVCWYDFLSEENPKLADDIMRELLSSVFSVRYIQSDKLVESIFNQMLIRKAESPPKQIEIIKNLLKYFAPKFREKISLDLSDKRWNIKIELDFIVNCIKKSLSDKNFVNQLNVACQSFEFEEEVKAEIGRILIFVQFEIMDNYLVDSLEQLVKNKELAASPYYDFYARFFVRKKLTITKETSAKKLLEKILGLGFEGQAQQKLLTAFLEVFLDCLPDTWFVSKKPQVFDEYFDLLKVHLEKSDDIKNRLIKTLNNLFCEVNQSAKFYFYLLQALGKSEVAFFDSFIRSFEENKNNVQVLSGIICKDHGYANEFMGFFVKYNLFYCQAEIVKQLPSMSKTYPLIKIYQSHAVYLFIGDHIEYAKILINKIPGQLFGEMTREKQAFCLYHWFVELLERFSESIQGLKSVEKVAAYTVILQCFPSGSPYDNYHELLQAFVCRLEGDYVQVFHFLTSTLHSECNILLKDMARYEIANLLFNSKIILTLKKEQQQSVWEAENLSFSEKEDTKLAYMAAVQAYEYVKDAKHISETEVVQSNFFDLKKIIVAALLRYDFLTCDQKRLQEMAADNGLFFAAFAELSNGFATFCDYYKPRNPALYSDAVKAAKPKAEDYDSGSHASFWKKTSDDKKSSSGIQSIIIDIPKITQSKN